MRFIGDGGQARRVFRWQSTSDISGRRSGQETPQMRKSGPVGRKLWLRVGQKRQVLDGDLGEAGGLGSAAAAAGPRDSSKEGLARGVVSGCLPRVVLGRCMSLWT